MKFWKIKSSECVIHKVNWNKRQIEDEYGKQRLMEELQEEFYEGKEMRDELQCEFDEVKKAVVC